MVSLQMAAQLMRVPHLSKFLILGHLYFQTFGANKYLYNPHAVLNPEVECLRVESTKAWGDTINNHL
jgi:hypothetical protein